MAARLLDYHAYLYRKYDLPVISIIVYPFRTTVATSPLEEISHGKTVLIFHFQVFPLWLLNAEKYVQEHAVAMYALLPAMDNGQLINRAIDEMIQYYRNDEHTFAREIRWPGFVVRRAEIVPLEEKRMIEERLAMFDDLMEKDPKMQRIRAEIEARGEAKGTRIMLRAFIQMRFPALHDQARKK